MTARMKFSGGLPETRCGAGSKIENTAQARAIVPQVIAELTIRSLLDAPCGDFNWMARTDLRGVDYLGCDFDPGHIDLAQRRAHDPARFAPASKFFFVADLTRDVLPRADLILSRDFLQHLPGALARKALSNFVASGATWLLATSHENLANGDIDYAGGFRPLNLTLPPINLPQPVMQWPEPAGCGRNLGLWSLADVDRVLAQSSAPDRAHLLEGEADDAGTNRDR